MVEMNNSTFSFDFICHKEIVKEFCSLCNKNSFENTGISVKSVKENKDFISRFLHHNFNNSLLCSTFPSSKKYTDLKPSHKKNDKNKNKKNNNQLVFFQVYAKYMKE